MITVKASDTGNGKGRNKANFTLIMFCGLIKIDATSRADPYRIISRRIKHVHGSLQNFLPATNMGSYFFRKAKVTILPTANIHNGHSSVNTTNKKEANMPWLSYYRYVLSTGATTAKNICQIKKAIN